MEPGNVQGQRRSSRLTGVAQNAKSMRANAPSCHGEKNRSCSPSKEVLINTKEYTRRARTSSADRSTPLHAHAPEHRKPREQRISRTIAKRRISRSGQKIKKGGFLQKENTYIEKSFRSQLYLVFPFFLCQTQTTEQ